MGHTQANAISRTTSCTTDCGTMTEQPSSQPRHQRGTERFDLLTDVFGDPDMSELWTEVAAIKGWLGFEGALATAQGELDLIPKEAAAEILAVCDSLVVDTDLLWERMRSVGYPILPLVEQITAAGGEAVGRYVHWGATTQDAMDCGLASQLAASISRLKQLLVKLGDTTNALAQREARTTMSARTHAQIAVPTTLGAKLAVYVAEFARHMDRLNVVGRRACVVQLFGAGGTAAAYGSSSKRVRRRVAELLDLASTDIPWHTARDSLAECLWVLGAITATIGKLAKEIISLSRTEIGELREGSEGLFRGASSTMPQKANPITSEVLVGLSGASVGISQTGYLFMPAGHERSAGEWQIEWHALPESFRIASSALLHANELVFNLEVNRERMAANMALEGGMLMAESAMMLLAPEIGRHDAHELLHQTCANARATGSMLEESLRTGPVATCFEGKSLEPADYLGEATQLPSAAADLWNAAKGKHLPTMVRSER